MNIVLFTHPEFSGSQSMPRFAEMIARGMRGRGHQVDVWTPRAICFRLPVFLRLKKWLGYVDQFILFPVQVRLRLRRLPADTLFVFADQALGPWVPLVASRPHVIHCHDFLALRSALGEFPQNPISWTGKVYQSFIRRGFSQATNFMSVSRRTQKDLHRLLSTTKDIKSSVVYNGLNRSYERLPRNEAFDILKAHAIDGLEEGFVLHVGGNQWYKNRHGVLAIYANYANSVYSPLPLVMVGASPDQALKLGAERIRNGQVRFVANPPSEVIEAAYSLSSALLFPSIAEGFGWPVIEAMACGCPVLTTGDSPMSEIGGSAATYLPVLSGTNMVSWASSCASLLLEVLSRSADEAVRIRSLGFAQVRQFEAEKVLQQYESIYRSVVAGGIK